MDNLYWYCNMYWFLLADKLFFNPFVHYSPSAGGSAWALNIKTKNTGRMYIQYFAKKDRLSFPLPEACSDFSCSIFLMYV